MSAPELSIITGCWNRHDGLSRLIASIQQHTTVSWELVVSDASDGPYLPQHEHVRIFSERPKLGCVRGYNNAFRLAIGRYVLWLNDDATVLPHYDAAVAFMDNTPKVGLGALYYAQAEPPFVVNKYWNMVYANFGIIRRDLGIDIGWFDEDLDMYGCDNSLAFRVLLANKGIATIPEARVWHHVVLDEQKRGNQQYREPDAAMLKRKYAYRYERMRKVYDRTAHLCEPMVIGE